MTSDNHLKIIQQHLSEMVIDVVRVCDEHEIPLFAVGGTLLGAIRYKGFIPWDDDLDFGLYRSDLPRLVAVLKESEKYDIHVPTPNISGNYVRFPKIYRKNTTYLQTTEDVSFDQRLFLDIFTIENVPNNSLVKLWHGMRSEIYSMIGSYVFFTTEGSFHLSKKRSIVRFIIRTIGKFFGFRSYSYWNGKAFEIFGKYQNKQTKEVTLPGGAKHYFGEILPRSVFGKGQSIPFERISIRAPEDMAGYLTNRYGSDYMTPPSESERVNHNIVFFEIDGEVIIK